MMEDIVSRFKNTLDLCETKYKSETDKLEANTTVYHKAVPVNKPKVEDMKITFVHAGMLEIAQTLSGHLCMLNFADAFEPGGCVWVGATTQEECICYCSNLYKSLTLDKCKQGYYYYNGKYGDSKAFSDSTIYTKDVFVFRGNYGFVDLDNPFHIDIITCPCPLAVAATDEIVTNRMRCFLSIAANNDVETLILGAWGCGAFGNRPYIIGRCFGTALSELKYFKHVIFAVLEYRDCDGKLISLKNGFYNTYNLGG